MIKNDEINKEKLVTVTGGAGFCSTTNNDVDNCLGTSLMIFKSFFNEQD